MSTLTPEPGWRPIDTAPKDGTPILLWDERGAAIGRWNHSVTTVNGEVRSDYAFWKAPGRGLLMSDFTPEYWMPLPEAPGAGPVDKGEYLDRIAHALDRIARAMTSKMEFHYGDDWETPRG